MNNCTICPRRCHADRADGKKGFCGADDTLTVSRCFPHMWEEPPLSGTRGAGTVFFSGCSLRCVYCQNFELSRAEKGKPVTEEQLCEMILDLAALGVHCIDLVTPTHYSEILVRVLRKIKPSLGIPVVWNCGGYDSVETLKTLEGLVDVYLPDFKYASAALAQKYSGAPDYPEVARAALEEMYRQTGPVVFDGDGLIKRGVIVRHLVLPGGRHDSDAVLRTIAKTVPAKGIRLSLMSQYTPDFVKDSPYRELHRRITSFEYAQVMNTVQELGFEGYFQERSSADSKYTPEF